MTNFDNPLTEADRQVILYNVVSFNAVSIFCCLLVLALYFYFKKRHTASVNRVSIRLAVATAAVDLVYSIVQIWSNMPLQELQCIVSTWAYVFVTLLSCFLIAMVAVNLHLVFLLNKERTEVYEKWYYLVSVVLSFILASVGWIADQYGMDPAITGCWFKNDGVLEGLLWQWAVLYGWITLIFLYCVVVVIAVCWHIHKELSRLERSSTPVSPSNSALQLRSRQTKRLRVLRRILLYPSIPLISQALSVVVAMDIFFTRQHSFSIVILSYATTSLQGLLSSSIFLTDPMIWPLIMGLFTPTAKFSFEDEEAAPTPKKAPRPVPPIRETTSYPPPPYSASSFSGDHFFAEELGADNISLSQMLANRSDVADTLGELEEILSMSKY